MMPLCALVLPVLLIACGLAIDLGLMESHSLTMQQAADAAAASAELELERGTGQWAAAARATAAVNGYEDGEGDVNVSVSMMPATGPYAGNHDAVAVTINDQVNTIFMRLVSEPSAAVAVRSVALAPPCVYLTGGAVALAGSGSSLSLNCPLYASRGVVLDDSSAVSALAENVTGAPGESNASRMSPEARFNAVAMTDPLLALAEPALGSCAHTSFKQSGGTATLTPGTYCKGMTLSNTNVTLQPGLYVITGGAHWSGANVQGTGVTLFFTKSSGAPVGQFVIDAKSRITLSAPAGGTALAGVAVFGTRAWTATAAQDFIVTDSTVHGDGIWYMAGSGLLLSNTTMDCDHYLGLDTRTLVMNASRMSGGGDFSRVATGSPLRPLGGLVQ